MRTLIWSSTFVHALKRAMNRHPELKSKIEPVLEQLIQNPFHPSLHSHKLRGEFAGTWACKVDYDYRIIFELVRSKNSNEDDVHLLTLGTHDEVY